MDVVTERCAGIDIGKKTMAVTIRVSGDGKRRRSETRTFGTMTSQVLALRDWLAAEQVQVAGMEATGDYWKPVYYLLEDAVECWLLNASHLKAVPGRKTDVKDSDWIAQLVEHGLVRPSFVPPPPIRRLRDLTRYRKTVIEERTREVQRLEKILEDAGIKLSAVASSIVGASGRAMLDALINGERDPVVLATWPRPRCDARPRCCSKRCWDASTPTTRSWCGRCWPASTPPTPPARDSRPRSPPDWSPFVTNSTG
jgi:transposase